MGESGGPILVKLRLVPADSHWQLGKVERHGGAVKCMVSRLVSQFAPVGAQELSLIVASCVAAKNSLMRWSGSSPAQWVFGKNPNLPGALLSSGGDIEACQLANDSQALQRIEQMRVEAMTAFHRFEYDSALRAALIRVHTVAPSTASALPITGSATQPTVKAPTRATGRAPS